MKTNPFTNEQQDLQQLRPENSKGIPFKWGHLKFPYFKDFRSILLLVMALIATTTVLAQAPTAVVKKTIIAPVIDGMVDDIWAQANEYNISLPYRQETPTLGAVGETTWKALWNDKGIFILVKVADNVFSPPYLSSVSSNWMYDKVEIYFDCNAQIKDGLGYMSSESGHYCFAPAPEKDKVSGGRLFDFYPNNFSHSYNVGNPSYVVEYFIPFSKLLDKKGVEVDRTHPIGFDIYIIDNDQSAPDRNRMVWANNGVAGENYVTMDNVGLITLDPKVDTSVLWNTFNLVKNWNFTSDLTPSWGGWIDGAVAGQTAPVIENGVVSMTSGLASDGNYWHYQFNQSGLKAEPNVPYILTFKSWSSITKLNDVDFEDSPQNNYNRYGASTNTGAINGRSEWIYETTTEPAWYTFHVTFDQMVPTTEQKIQWTFSNAKATTYLDSVMLVKENIGEPPMQNTPFLSLSTSNINVSETEASAILTISSNTDWEIRADQTWLTTNPLTGYGNKTITVTAQANPFFINRVARLTVYATSVATKTITVLQNAKQGIPEPPKDSIVEIWSSEAWNTYNLIKNWNFTAGLDQWNGWVDGSVADQIAPFVSNGCLVMKTGYSMDGNNWHYQHNQWSLKAQPNVSYTLKFKAWSNKPRPNGLVFEDSPQNNYNRYGASTDKESINGRAEWLYYTSTAPQWFTFHVVFDQMVPSTEQKIQWMLSSADATSYLDSIILIRDADLLLIKDADLVLSSNNLRMAATKANTTVNVSSNTNSLAISDQNWLKVDPPIVSGNQLLTIAADANPTNTSRTATVTIYPAGIESQTITITQESTTGLDLFSPNTTCRLYPNPTSGVIKLVLDKIPAKGTSLTIRDVTGKTILKQLLKNKEEWIDLKGNRPGVYLMKTNEKDSKVQKIIFK